MRKLALTFLLALAAIAAAAPSPALAGVTFILGNNPQPGEENILFADQGPAATLTGTSTTNPANMLTLTGTTTTGTQFTVLSNVITADSGLITSILINPSSPLSALILNPLVLAGTPTGTEIDYSVTMTDSNIYTFSMFLGTGSNFLTIVGTSGEDIASVSLSDTTGFSELTSVRAAFLPAVPEPASWAMMLLGFAVIGLAMRRTRKAAEVLAG